MRTAATRWHEARTALVSDETAVRDLRRDHLMIVVACTAGRARLAHDDVSHDCEQCHPDRNGH